MIKTIFPVIFAVVFSSAVLATESVISIASHYPAKETADRFEKILAEKDFTIFTRINHQKNAASVNLELDPSEVIIFGNPKVGTLLMQCSKTAAIDLPQKALFWEDAQGQGWLSYNNPEYLKKRHNIQAVIRLLTKFPMSLIS